MLVIGGLLAALALLLAWPVPLALHRRRRTTSDPLAYLVLWQSIGLSGGLALIGAVIVYALAPLGGNLPAAVLALRDHRALIEGGAIPALRLTLLVLGLLYLAHLCLMLAYSAFRAQQQRRRHRALLTVLTTPDAHDPHTRILPTSAPVAYCLPSGGTPTTVLSTGLVSLLNEAERRAVVEHETAHLRLRHDVLMLPFLAWRKASPGFFAPKAALASVRELIEIMADDAARRRVPCEDLRSAIEKTAAGEDGGLRPEVRYRLERLSAPLPPVSLRTRTALIAAAGGLFLVPTVMVLGSGLYL